MDINIHIKLTTYIKYRFSSQLPVFPLVSIPFASPHALLPMPLIFFPLSNDNLLFFSLVTIPILFYPCFPVFGFPCSVVVPLVGNLVPFFCLARIPLAFLFSLSFALFFASVLPLIFPSSVSLGRFSFVRIPPGLFQASLVLPFVWCLRYIT